MVEFLLGVPGRLVALGATLATGISDILTAIGTRAPASSAVSNAVLTDSRVANLDNIDTPPLRLKVIRRGTIQIFSEAGTNIGEVTIPAVNMEKTELRMLGYRGGSDFVSIELIGPTAIRARRTTVSTTMQHIVSWELTEYE